MSIIHDDNFQNSTGSPQLTLETLGWDTHWEKTVQPVF